MSTFAALSLAERTLLQQTITLRTYLCFDGLNYTGHQSPERVCCQEINTDSKYLLLQCTAIHKSM